MTGNQHPAYRAFSGDGPGGWYVLVLRDDGRQETWTGFATEEEMLDWIARDKENQSRKKSKKPVAAAIAPPDVGLGISAALASASPAHARSARSAE